MPEEKRSPVGAILVTIGFIIFAFVIVSRAMNLSLGPIAGLLEDYLIIPIGMIFAGRMMIRSAKRNSPTQTTVPQTRRSSKYLPIEEWVERQTAAATRPPVPAPAPVPREHPKPPRKPKVEVEKPPAPLYVPPPKTGEFKPKSSEQMIAEAKRRLQTPSKNQG